MHKFSLKFEIWKWKKNVLNSLDFLITVLFPIFLPLSSNWFLILLTLFLCLPVSLFLSFGSSNHQHISTRCSLIWPSSTFAKFLSLSFFFFLSVNCLFLFSLLFIPFLTHEHKLVFLFCIFFFIILNYWISSFLFFLNFFLFFIFTSFSVEHFV